MKFSEMPYVRPDLAAFQAKAEEIAQKIAGAASAQEQIDAVLAFDQVQAEMSTATSLAYVRHTIDTRDEFYDKENDYADEIAPAVQEAEQKVTKALLVPPSALSWRIALESCCSPIWRSLCAPLTPRTWR